MGSQLGVSTLSALLLCGCCLLRITLTAVTTVTAMLYDTITQQAAAAEVVVWSGDRSQAPINQLAIAQRGPATRAWCCLLLLQLGGRVLVL